MFKCALILIGIVAAPAEPCLPPEIRTWKEHHRYERSLDLERPGLFHMPAARRPGTPEGRPIPKHRQRSSRRSPPRAPVRERKEETTGAFRLHPTTPYVGSPEWERERAWEERREKALKRALGGICARC